ncbi:craniofacial development protein 1 [Cyclospora cayetanensis]|uniref:Craniofacial development protein 1 n=1 Tax=Cyclospora cayetanensis TaxID=88456 RepID=A0A6P6S1D2_9EIME|nr:craniofacial development protein 1 [Cyclospora cayetanensis]
MSLLQASFASDTESDDEDFDSTLRQEEVQARRQQLQQRAAADAVYEELRKQHQLAVKGYPASQQRQQRRQYKQQQHQQGRQHKQQQQQHAAEERLPKDYVNLLEELFRKVGKGCDLCAAGAGALRDAGAALSEKTITKTVRFAGREFQIEEKVSAERFAAFEKRQQKQHVQVKGKLQALDALDKALGSAATVNSVQKSRADWSQFKEKAGIEDELRRGRGQLVDSPALITFLRKAPVFPVTWHTHEEGGCRVGAGTLVIARPILGAWAASPLPLLQLPRVASVHLATASRCRAGGRGLEVDIRMILRHCCPCA